QVVGKPVAGDRNLAGPLQVTLHRAGLRPEPVAGGRAGHLLIAAGARVVIAAIAIARHRLVVIAGAIGGDRLVVALRLVASHRLVVRALDVLRGATRLRAASGGRVVAADDRLALAAEAAHLKYVVPGRVR